MLVNSLSKHTDTREVQDSENTTLPLTTSGGQVIELNLTEQEDSEPNNEDLQRIIELMDGFKASKVSRGKKKKKKKSIVLLKLFGISY